MTHKCVLNAETDASAGEREPFSYSRDIAHSVDVLEQREKATNFYHGPMVELTEAMTSMGVSGGQTVLASNTYQRVAHCLQDLAPSKPEEVRGSACCRLV